MSKSKRNEICNGSDFMDIWQWVNTTDNTDAESAKMVRIDAEKMICQGKAKVTKAILALQRKGIQEADPSFVIHHCNIIQSGKTKIMEGQKVLKLAEAEAWLAYNIAIGYTVVGKFASPEPKEIETVKEVVLTQ